MANLIFGSVSIFFSAILYFAAYRVYKKSASLIAVLLIIGGGMILRVFVGGDTYLHTWDEQYHALVSKNIMNDPPHPKLYKKALLSYDHKNWIANYTWLEKGPVPLWSMALSMKIFGSNVYALRIPSLLLSLLAIYLSFLTGKLIFNEKIGLLAAFLHSIHGLLIELGAGRISSDHVETFFVVFVQLAIYLSFVIIKRKGNPYLAIAIGTATGLAILSKWFPALLVFPVWFSAALTTKENSWKAFTLQMAIAIGTCLLVCAPYFIYIFTAFPVEARHVVQKFLGAYSSTIEGHEAPIYFYLHKIGMLFGELIYLPIIYAFYQIIKGNLNPKLWSILFWIIIPIFIFSLAETKRITYMMISAPAFFLFTAYYFDYFKNALEKVKARWILIVALFLMLALPVRYSIERIKPFQKMDRYPSLTLDIKKVDELLVNYENPILFNVKPYIKVMFYSNYLAYDRFPDLVEIQYLKKLGYQVIIQDGKEIPAELQYNPQVRIIKLFEDQ